MRKNVIYLFVFVSVLLLIGVAFCGAISAPSKNRDDNMKLIFEQHAYEQEGRRFEQLNDFENAKKMYEKAIEYDVKLVGDPRGRPMAFLIEIYQKEGEYQQALEKLRYLKQAHTKHERYKDWELELKALVEYQRTKVPKAVYDFIEQYRQRRQKFLPPVACDATEVTTLLRLYDTIGDYDAGIKLTDECLAYIYKQHPELKKVINSDEAAKYISPKDDPSGVIRDHYLVREAFEQDKKDGTKGRVTKALIQSDYFPW